MKPFYHHFNTGTSSHYIFKLMLLILLLPVVYFYSTAQSGKEKIKPLQEKPVALLTVEKHRLTYRIISSEQGSFGYDIIDADKKLVHQPSIPGLPGNKGFKKKEDAGKCARLVISKIEKNMMPPTVTRLEMDSLNIKF